MLVYALVARPQRARGPRADPRGRAREATERRAAARPEGLRLVARVRRCSTRSSRATWKTTSRSRSSRRQGHDADTVRRVDAAHRPQRVQASPGAARRAGVAEGVRQGPPAPDHQPLARLAASQRRDGAEPAASPPRPRSSSRRSSTASRSRSCTTRSRTSRRSRTSSALQHRHAACSRRSRCRRSRTPVTGPARALARRCARRRSPLRRVRDPDRRPAVHVAFDVGIRHGALRGAHAGRRVGGHRRLPVRPVWRGSCSRRSACICSPAPTSASGGASCSRSRARCCSPSTSCTSARTRPAAARRRSPRLQLGDGRGALGAADGRAGHRHAHARSRCSRSCSRASRARRSRCRCSCGASSASRRAGRADPAGGAGVRRDRRVRHGERLGAVELVGGGRDPRRGSRCRSSGPRRCRRPRRRRVTIRSCLTARPRAG